MPEDEKRRSEAKDRFYPGWWTYGQNRMVHESLKPYFRVVCHSRAEYELASKVKPDSVRAEIINLGTSEE